MLLPPEQAARFYRIWWALLRYANESFRVVPDLPDGDGPLPVPLAKQVRDVLWAEDVIREAFVCEGYAESRLSEDDVDLISSWDRRVAGQFLVVRHLKKHSVLLDTAGRGYAVVGLLSPLEEVVGPQLPAMVETVLIPFGDKIVYDGLVDIYDVSFGPGARRSIEQDYRDAREDGLIKSLTASASVW